MSVFVDNARMGYGSMRMCHMLADSTQELLEMADRIGVKRKWIQSAGTWREHFDICLTKRELAIKNGAVEKSQKELALMRRNRITNGLHGKQEHHQA